MMSYLKYRAKSVANMAASNILITLLYSSVDKLANISLPLNTQKIEINTNQILDKI